MISDAFKSVVCLEKFPKSEIEIGISILEDDGSLLGSSILAANLALIDAGIEIFDFLVGISILMKNSEIFYDPNFEEEKEIATQENSGVVTIGLMPNFGQISTFLVNGSVDFSSIFPGAIKNLFEISAKLNESMRICLTKSIKDRIK